MESPASPVPDPSPLANRDRALGIIENASVLALLYFARGVLVPITLAIILSLLIAPLVRVLRRLGLGQTLSVLAAVLVLALAFAAVAGVIGSQLIRMVQSLPRYERTIERKLKTLDDVTVGRFNALTGQAGRFMNPHPAEEQSAASQRSGAAQRTRTAQESSAAQESGTPQQPGTLQEPGTTSQESDTSQEPSTTSQGSGTS